ncbi:DNA alkylation repair protein [Streptomyces sp. HMX112]|uniref:DNA alkylation repair protein n=1 Tax=Streptomyces sp. HMX112 TaxID=3390850 RepID=UPI003A8136A3
MGAGGSAGGPLRRRRPRRDPAAGAVLERWITDPDFWLRRSALLALLPAIRAGRPDSARLIRYADALVGAREFFQGKAQLGTARDLPPRPGPHGLVGPPRLPRRPAHPQGGVTGPERWDGSGRRVGDGGAAGGGGKELRVGARRSYRRPAEVGAGASRWRTVSAEVGAFAAVTAAAAAHDRCRGAPGRAGCVRPRGSGPSSRRR